jgi:hypothetical protein
MTDVQSLRGLKERCEKAVGLDRELDRDIGFALDGWFVQPLEIQIPPSTLSMIHIPATDGGYHIVSDHPGSEYTSFTESIEAAISLIEKLLPGWGYYFRKDSEGAYAEGCFAGLIYPKYNLVTAGSATAATPALALLAALLEALIAQAPVPPAQGGDEG